MKKIRRKRLLTGKERKPQMLDVNSSRSNLDRQSRGTTANQSRYQRNIVTDEDKANMDDQRGGSSGHKKRKKGKKGGAARKKGLLNEMSEIPMKRPKISRE